MLSVVFCWAHLGGVLEWAKRCRRGKLSHIGHFYTAANLMGRSVRSNGKHQWKTALIAAMSDKSLHLGAACSRRQNTWKTRK